MSVQTNEVRERDGLAQDIGVRDRGACNVRRGSRDVSERGEGLDVSNVAGHTNAVGCFSGGVAVEGEWSRRIERWAGKGWHGRIVGVDRGHLGTRERKG